MNFKKIYNSNLDFIFEYKEIAKDLNRIYLALDEALFSVLFDIEEDQSRKLIESEEYDRVIATIDNFKNDIQLRINKLKTLEKPDTVQANRVSNHINRITQNVHGFHDSVFGDSDLSNDLDNFSEKRDIKSKCIEYFNILQELNVLLQTKAPDANKLDL